MQALMAFSGITAKIRAMEKNVLQEADFMDLVSLESVPQAVVFLRQNPAYTRILKSLDENELHRGEVEKKLRISVYDDFTKLYRFSNQDQRSFLRVYFKRYEVEIIKEYLRSIFDHRKVHLNLSDFEDFFAKHSKLDLQAMSNCNTIDELVALLRNTDYYASLKRLENVDKSTLFDYEMALDLYNFTTLWKRITEAQEKHESANLEKALGTKYDLLNLIWIYRCKKYYSMPAADIYAILIPVNYRISKHEIQELVEAESMDVFDAVIAKSYYARAYMDFNPQTMERMYAGILGGLLKRLSRRDPYSIATMYSYLHHKEHEVGRVIIALESVRYRIPPDEAIGYVHSN